FVATALNISTARVYGVATFFSYFALEPKGKHIIKVCDGTACHVKRSEEIINSVRNKLQLKDNEKNSKDMLFALETVSCLGACGLAPVLVVDEKVYSQTTADSALQIIDDIMTQELKESIAEGK
ncbi:MAG: NAD(P)H-dependent oxidoreductase subunit E, partial [Endomicrobium sp.]|nr:NAD(P)H-dependent oxidoreductase subunit E [Endomicrobium sp.]